MNRFLQVWQDHSTIPGMPQPILAGQLSAAIRIIYLMAEAAYKEQVVDTEMEESWVGEGKEYADKQDWLDSYIDQYVEQVVVVK